MPESDKAIMDAILLKEKKGWERLTPGTLQYISDHGYGFVIRSIDDWNWIATRVFPDSIRKEGSCTLLEAAMQQVKNVIS